MKGQDREKCIHTLPPAPRPLSTLFTALPFRRHTLPWEGKSKHLLKGAAEVARQRGEVCGDPGQNLLCTGRRGASDTDEGQLNGERALRCSVRSRPLRGSGRPPGPQFALLSRPSRPGQLQPNDRSPRWGPRHRCRPNQVLANPGGWGGTSRGTAKAPKGETRGSDGAQHPRRRGLTSKVETVLVNRSSPSSSSSKSVGFPTPSGGGSLSAAIFARPDYCASGTSRTCHVSTHG